MLTHNLNFFVEKLPFSWTRSTPPVHDDYAVGLLLSDAKEFAMDRSGGQCCDGTLASLLFLTPACHAFSSTAQ